MRFMKMKIQVFEKRKIGGDTASGAEIGKKKDAEKVKFFSESPNFT